jgi:thioredoxin reductase (NADPH)
MFLMIGAEPNAKWLDRCLALDAKGSSRLVTMTAARRLRRLSPRANPAYLATDDARSGSVKHVAGIGEGSVVVHAIHQFLNPGVA